MDIYDIALTLQQGLGLKGVAHVLSVMGTAKQVYEVSAEELMHRTGLREDLAGDISRRTAFPDAEKEMRFLEKNSLTGLASTDDSYPQLLRECPDYPHVLYVKGDPAVLKGDRLLSMVGTRSITPYGQRMCDALIRRMAEIACETVIVSGLAFGVDANCHRAALEHGLHTVAVLANSLPGITPAQNTPLAERIVESGGAIVSELHTLSKQKGVFYIPRNRIVAGMSQGTVIVESAHDGGSLTTANLAYGYNRTVMAVPGRAGDRCSEGTNNLIKRSIASLVCSAEDIVHELGWDMGKAGSLPVTARNYPILSAAEQALLKCFGRGENLGLDELSQRSGASVGETAAMMLNLEIGGVVRSLPGKIYEVI